MCASRVTPIIIQFGSQSAGAERQAAQNIVSNTADQGMNDEALPESVMDPQAVL